MTIKEIAAIAGVSVSTVSKIMNGKDETISVETREKVLKIAKDYQYTPYASVLSGTGGKTFLLGLLIESQEQEMNVLKGIYQEAAEHGYGVICYQHHGSMEVEQKYLIRLCANRIDGLIWKRVSEESTKYREKLTDNQIPVVYMDDNKLSDGTYSYSLDFGKFGYDATRYLIYHKHQRVVCFSDQMDERYERFVKGYQKCLFDYKIEGAEEAVYGEAIEKSLTEMVLRGVTAVICFNEKTANAVLRQAWISSYQIPRELSVIMLGWDNTGSTMLQKLTTLRLPFESFGGFVCRKLIGVIENTGQEPDTMPEWVEFESEESVVCPTDKNRKKIVVVGSINMDTTIGVSKLAESGETVMAESFAQLPGGKGLNQAVGVARLGARVELLGRVGCDYEAKVLRDIMVKNGIPSEFVLETEAAGTGKAYITVQKNGESSIIVYGGANTQLSCSEIIRHKRVFEDASYCLLQLETPNKSVQTAAECAVENGAQVILKPAASKEVSDYLLARTAIFVPNEKELNSLCEGPASLEEKAQHFLDKGVKHVIVTLGHKGCYLKDEENSIYFSAADFEPVDTTGAADAFIAALAVYLAEGADMVSAIQTATYAAGLSITRQGAQSSLVERQTLDLYGEEISKSIKVRRGNKNGEGSKEGN